MKPFTEAGMFDLMETGSFFMTGSPEGVGEKPGSFSGPLRDKAQIRLSFPVKNQVKMLANTSSIYYFNVRDQQWGLPKNAVNDHVGPFNKFAVSTGPITGEMDPYTDGSQIIEDFKGIDYRGRLHASGNLQIYRTTNGAGPAQSEPELSRFGQTYEKLVAALVKDYPKSIQRAQLYDAQSYELIDFGVTEPFLLEKAVFEIPFTMGPTWFQDRTLISNGVSDMTYYPPTYPIAPSSDGGKTVYWDRGGPSITLSLFSQKNYGLSSIRDAVLSGVITHSLDRKRNVTKTQNQPGDTADSLYSDIQDFFVHNIGIDSSECAAVVYPENSYYTGSCIIRCEAGISNGPSGILRIYKLLSRNFGKGFSTSLDAYIDAKIYQTPEDFLVWANNLFSSKTIAASELNLDKTLYTSNIIWTGIDAFGRGMTGFSPSGGSIFGGEYSLPVKSGSDSSFNNPWYIEDEDERQADYIRLSSSIASVTPGGLSPPVSSPTVLSYVQLYADAGNLFSSVKNSPYLIRPGEKFVLAMSKTRPAHSASLHKIVNADFATGTSIVQSVIMRTGSIQGHDVHLATGTINITLYGSYVREGSNVTR